MANRACNLLAKDALRAALADEIKESGPQVAFVGLAELLSGTAEWLAGATTSPNRSVCWPSGKLKCERPTADSGEEMTLGVAFKFIGFYFEDAAFVHFAGRDKSAHD